jgi:hypothetical protein
MSFCNKLNIPIFYNTLYNPKHLALYSLHSADLQGIIDNLSNFDFEAKNSVQKQNNNFYYDFINLLKRWQQDAVNRENKIINNFRGREELKNEIIKKVKSNS